VEKTFTQNHSLAKIEFSGAVNSAQVFDVLFATKLVLKTAVYPRKLEK